MTIHRAIVFILLLGLSITTCFYYMKSAEEQVNEYKAAMSLTHAIHSDLLMMRRNEKDYMSRLLPVYIEQHRKNTQKLKYDLQQLNTLLKRENAISEQILKINQHLDNYLNLFNDVIQVQTSLGVSPDHGIYGLLRQSAHEVEHILSIHHLEGLLNLFLSLRKVEKDFMLHPAEKRLTEFTALYEEILSKSKDYNLSQNINLSLAITLKKYHDYFLNFSNLTLKKGATDHPGLLGNLSAKAQLLEREIADLGQQVMALSSMSEENTRISTKILSITFPVLVLLLLLMPFIMNIPQSNNEDNPGYSKS